LFFDNVTLDISASIGDCRDFPVEIHAICCKLMVMIFVKLLFGEVVMERSVTLIVNAAVIIIIGVMLVTHAKF